MRRDHLPGILLALTLLGATLGTAVAQDVPPVLVRRIDTVQATADVGVAGSANFSLYNLNPRSEFYVTASVDRVPGWTIRVGPAAEFLLGPRNTSLVDVTFEPRAPFQTQEEFTVRFRLVNVDTGNAFDVTDTVMVKSLAAPLILDAFPNLLPPPFDNVYGTFLVDMLFWTGFALGAILVGDTVVRILTARASSATTREIVSRLRRPLFLFVFFLGLARSFAVLPRNPFTDTVTRLLTAIGVVFFGLYVAYRILDAALLYYHRTWAARTHTTVDDIIIPLLRKVGIVVLYAVGAIIVLQNLGWDPTVVLAGAGIAGLVIAFAAQDTFSNLFSGVFILLDRPFKEGDDIQLDTGEFVRVENIGLRTTRLYHPRNHETITLPNNQLATKRIVNLTAPDTRYVVSLEVGVAYDADIEHVSRVLNEAALAHPKVLRDPAGWSPLVLFIGFGDSALNFLIRVPIANYLERGIIGSEVRRLIKERFDAEGIEIPFPQRTLWIKGNAPPDASFGR